MVNEPGQVEITFRFSRHIGPRYVGAGLTLEFDALRPYSFVSRAEWPEQNHDESVREVVEEVLMERLGSLERVAVVLKSIEFHEVDSSEMAFRRAARAATEAAFRA